MIYILSFWSTGCAHYLDCWAYDLHVLKNFSLQNEVFSNVFKLGYDLYFWACDLQAPPFCRIAFFFLWKTELMIYFLILWSTYFWPFVCVCFVVSFSFCLLLSLLFFPFFPGLFLLCFSFPVFSLLSRHDRENGHYDRENGHQNFPIFSLAGWVKQQSLTPPWKKNNRPVSPLVSWAGLITPVAPTPHL